MANIFDDFPSSKSQGGARATNGGQQTPKDIPYDPPVGPKGQSHEGPGLGGDVHGCGTQGKH